MDTPRRELEMKKNDYLRRLRIIAEARPVLSHLSCDPTAVLSESWQSRYGDSTDGLITHLRMRWAAPRGSKAVLKDGRVVRFERREYVLVDSTKWRPIMLDLLYLDEQTGVKVAGRVSLHKLPSQAYYKGMSNQKAFDVIGRPIPNLPHFTDEDLEVEKLIYRMRSCLLLLRSCKF